MNSNCKQINPIPIGWTLPLFSLITTVGQASLEAHFLSASKQSHRVPTCSHLSAKQRKKKNDQNRNGLKTNEFYKT